MTRRVLIKEIPYDIERRIWSHTLHMQSHWSYAVTGASFQIKKGYGNHRHRCWYERLPFIRPFAVQSSILNLCPFSTYITSILIQYPSLRMSST